MRRGIGRLRAGGSGFSPISVFAGSAAGIWLDPSDITTGFTDSAGTTPQTASGQQTGLRLDKRLGLASGSEQVSNTGGPYIVTTGWTYPGVNGGSVSVSGGQLILTCGNPLSTVADRLCHSAMTGLVVGVTYKVVGTARNVTDISGLRVNVSTGPTDSDTTGVSADITSTSPTAFTLVFTASATTHYLRLVARNGSASAQVAASSLSVKSLAGNHVLQATLNSRPEYDVISGISSDFCDGIDDGYSTPVFVAGTLTSGMDLFCAIKRGSTSNMVLASNGVANASFIGKMIAADGTSSMAGVGTAWSVFVDGVQVGTTNAVTCGQLNTALGSGAYHVLEVRDLDLSAWTQFTLGLYTSFMLNADDGGVILPPAQSTANRAALRKWLGAKVGLSL